MKINNVADILQNKLYQAKWLFYIRRDKLELKLKTIARGRNEIIAGKVNAGLSFIRTQ